MTFDARDVLLRQYDMAWKLMSYHLESLTTEECLWRPALVGLHVHEDADGAWRADWPEHEGYELGPSSIAWLTWHACFWYAMAIDHSFGVAQVAREQVSWPGSADGVRETLGRLHTE
ncbi:MAG: DinB family protein, partial [Gemmatimonadota bacterium]